MVSEEHLKQTAPLLTFAIAVKRSGIVARRFNFYCHATTMHTVAVGPYNKIGVIAFGQALVFTAFYLALL